MWWLRWGRNHFYYGVAWNKQKENKTSTCLKILGKKKKKSLTSAPTPTREAITLRLWDSQAKQSGVDHTASCHQESACRVDEEWRDRQTTTDKMECAQYLYFLFSFFLNHLSHLLDPKFCKYTKVKLNLFFVKTVHNMSDRKRKTPTKLSWKAFYICKIAQLYIYIYKDSKTAAPCKKNNTTVRLR